MQKHWRAQLTWKTPRSPPFVGEVAGEEMVGAEEAIEAPIVETPPNQGLTAVAVDEVVGVVEAGSLRVHAIPRH